MPAEAGGETVTITINDVELRVPKGEPVFEAARKAGIDIPIFCYHPRLTSPAMCRMCLVEAGTKQPDGSVKKMGKPQTACTLPATEGLVIYTDTEQIHKDRRGVLEFLLINHPLDCPICDRGGECPLQNNTLFYGPSTSRYIELKRHLPKAFPLSKYVTLDLERCIQCGRCVRFTEEISGDSQLAFMFRGALMQPTTFKMTDFNSKFSGNTIEICPVGALTSTEYRFRARPWDLETKPSVCTICSNGCNMWFDHRVGKLVRVNSRENEAVNEEWTCDRGKFGHEFYNSSKRLAKTLIRRGDAFVEANWAEVYEEILKVFSVGGNRVAGLARADFSNEGLYLMQKLFRVAFKSNNLDYRWARILQRATERLEFRAGIRQVETPIADYERKKNIFIFGACLADEEPILYLRIRKAWFRNGAKVYIAHHESTDADHFAHDALRYKQGTEAVLLLGLLRLVAEKDQSSLPDALRKQLMGVSLEEVMQTTGVSSAAMKSVVDALFSGSSVIATTRNIMNCSQAQALLDLLAGIAILTGSEFNCYSLDASGQGAEDLGLLPDMLPGGRRLDDEEAYKTLESLWSVELSREPGDGTRGILEGCVSGDIKALWIVNADPINDFYDPDLARRALESVEFLVYQGILENETMGYASIVLPMQAPAEHDGSYTNLEHRVQRMEEIVVGPGTAKSAWRIFSEFLLRHKPTVPYFGPKEVMREIGEVVPWYKEAGYEHLEGEGVLVKPPLSREPNLDYLVEGLKTS